MKYPGYVRNLCAATDKRTCADIVGQAAGDDEVSSLDFARLCARYAKLWPDTNENCEEGGLTNGTQENPVSDNPGGQQNHRPV